MFDDLEQPSWLPAPHETGAAFVPLLSRLEASIELGLDQEAQELRCYLALGRIR
jgi:hypothetical protein